MALLTGRGWAYGYRHVERFLSWLAHAGAADRFTDALARWTTHLWQPAATAPTAPAYDYRDGHRTPVFSDDRIPRGLIGRTGAIERCRALVLLHDAQGHPLLATTHRGDQHLTIGLPQILARFAAATGERRIDHVVVDREGMGGDFLAGLVTAGCTVVTILRADQYDGLDSFTEVGDVVPLVRDRHGVVVREVVPARFALPIPSRPGKPLPLCVALIRDLRYQVPLPSPDDAVIDTPVWAHASSWMVGLSREQQCWWDPTWVATPMPAAPTQTKLIPIVTTAAHGDAVALAEVYTARWPQQENIIRDFLRPLSLDPNHGYAKTPVEHAEVAKQRTTLEQRRDRLQRWADSARERYGRAGRRMQRRTAEHNVQDDVRYRELAQQQKEREAQGVSPCTVQQIMRPRQAAVAADLKALMAQVWRADGAPYAEWQNIDR